MSGPEADRRRRPSIDHQMPHLVGLLDTASPDTPEHLRYQAAQALGTLWPRCAADPDLAERWAGPIGRALATAVHDDSPWVRFAAIRGLERVSGPAAVTALAHVLEDGEPRVRRRAVVAVGRIGPDAFTARLLEMAESSDPLLTLDVAETLAHLREPTREAVAALQAYRRSGDRHLARTAIRSLAHLARTATDLTSYVTSALHGALYSSDPDERLAAVQGLAILRPARWEESLVRALRDSVPLIRAVAMERLLQHVGADAIPYVRRLPADRDRQVRTRLAEALAPHVARPDVQALLRRLAGDAEATVAKAAYVALTPLGPAAVRPGLGHPHSAVRSVTAGILGETGDSTDLPRLLSLLRDRGAGVRWTAVLCLTRIRQRLHPSPRPFRRHLVEPIAALLHHDEHPYVRRYAACALAELGGPAAVAHIDRALSDRRIDDYTARRVQQLLGRWFELRVKGSR